MLRGTYRYNPYTGLPRHPEDIKSDPLGLEIMPPEMCVVKEAADQEKEFTGSIAADQTQGYLSFTDSGVLRISFTPLPDAAESSELVLRSALEEKETQLKKLTDEKQRLEWLHKFGPNNPDKDGYEWGVFKVLFNHHGQPVEVLQTNTDLSDLDAAMTAETCNKLYEDSWLTPLQYAMVCSVTNARLHCQKSLTKEKLPNPLGQSGNCN